MHTLGSPHKSGTLVLTLLHAPGREWRPQQCVIVTPPGPLPQVVSRGNCLNGSATAPAAPLRQPAPQGSAAAQAFSQATPQPQVRIQGHLLSNASSPAAQAISQAPPEPP